MAGMRLALELSAAVVRITGVEEGHVMVVIQDRPPGPPWKAVKFCLNRGRRRSGRRAGAKAERRRPEPRRS
jgi:hypothetical protein